VQSDGIVPLSGTTQQEHMRQDVAVEKASLAEGSEELLEAIRAYVRD
jgi:hypothetical protein